MIFATGLQFDWSISFGNLISGAMFMVLALLAWRDLTWRVKNLETWRSEHQIDADSRDKLIRNSETMLASLKYLVEEERKRS